MGEAAITINGVVLTPGQSMTVRVALNSFAMDLNADGLGDDDHGKTMTRLYLGRVAEIQQMSEIPPPPPADEE